MQSESKEKLDEIKIQIKYHQDQLKQLLMQRILIENNSTKK